MIARDAPQTRAARNRPFGLVAPPSSELMRVGITPLQPGDRLQRALELFVECDLLALPVVASSEEPRVIGLVKRADISSTYLRHVQGATTIETTPAGLSGR